jgi:hypothetical protein
MQSPPLLVTIFHYSIPEGMLGRGLNKYQSAAPDCLQRPLLRRSRFRQQVSASVMWHLTPRGDSSFDVPSQPEADMTLYGA